ncbi:CGP-CTERM sorting domain-containing protein [Palaeococcus sp. (in: euryarchaeotes)]
MKKVLFLIIGILMFSSFALAYEEQPVFDMNVYVTVYPSGTALFKINAKLKSPVEIYELENTLKTKGEAEANKKFEKLLESLIFRNFVNSVKERYPDAQIVIPADGLVKIGKNWSAVVQFKWYNYLVEKDKKLQSSAYGPMSFIYHNRVYSYSWKSFYLLLPKDAYVLNLAPIPGEFEENTAKWENGDYLPIIVITFDSSVYEEAMNKTVANKTKFIPFDEFIKNTTKSITLTYDPWSGFVKFNATFEGVNATSYHETRIREEFNKTMKIDAINSKIEGNRVLVWGRVKPDVKYDESFTKKTWNATLTLPFRFDKVNIEAPGEKNLEMTYQKTEGKHITVVIEEKKGICGPALILGVALIPLLIYRKRR